MQPEETEYITHTKLSTIFLLIHLHINNSNDVLSIYFIPLMSIEHVVNDQHNSTIELVLIQR